MHHFFDTIFDVFLLIIIVVEDYFLIHVVFFRSSVGIQVCCVSDLLFVIQVQCVSDLLFWDSGFFCNLDARWQQVLFPKNENSSSVTFILRL